MALGRACSAASRSARLSPPLGLELGGLLEAVLGLALGNPKRASTLLAWVALPAVGLGLGGLLAAVLGLTGGGEPKMAFSKA